MRPSELGEEGKSRRATRSSRPAEQQLTTKERCWQADELKKSITQPAGSAVETNQDIRSVNVVEPDKQIGRGVLSWCYTQMSLFIIPIASGHGFGLDAPRERARDLTHGIASAIVAAIVGPRGLNQFCLGGCARLLQSRRAPARIQAQQYIESGREISCTLDTWLVQC
ncbi:uncharacterized protein BCR38DRAFT_486583 [Pseudomassariella vexata]|uniref:Uncharacterized protein n=1 Tax=Pseudomassariella vexata TaxID=1141098 RepID=A0A1Y2DST8_9PEZI|nr:uncharacterized protein BCR38DRAFT_486583 [Pseudomassariella vexata]ORY62320.1 hypothetical protein BCR38DRAFT_486583 [Pseudomassariella vexata]